MAMIKDNISKIKQDIAAVCRRLGRDPQEITLIGVTKFAPVERIQEALENGIAHIGENKVQEGQKKYPLLKDCGHPVTKHMIGHLQSNKAGHALKTFDVLQSVDSLKLAQEIEKQATKLNMIAQILVQINTSGEEQKFGVDKPGAMSLIRDIARLSNLRILGLMTIAPLTEDKEIVRDCFRQLREIRDAAAQEFKSSERVQMKYLSMGMTDDYEIALEEGSNMVRIGRAIFAQ